MSSAKIKILDSNKKIEGNILSAMGRELKSIFTRKKPRIEGLIKQLVRESISNCPEIKSLQVGTLRYDFGLNYDPTPMLIEAIVNSVYVYFRSFKLSLTGVNNVLSIYIQPQDFNNLLSSDFSVIITEKGTALPWLEWLLTAGDAVVISSYRVSYGIYESSRSGGAIMIPDGFFKVDPEFSGTVENNFITRAIQKNAEQIEEIIRTNI